MQRALSFGQAGTAVRASSSTDSRSNLMTAPIDFKPILQRVAQDDRHSDILAVLASLSNSTLAQIRQQAEVFGVPQVGPYHSYTTDGDLIAKVAMSRGLVATNWRESKSFKDV